MIIVSNTSPLCYLVLIGHADVLANLYGEIHVTQKVLEELRHPDAPPSIRPWATTPPAWLKREGKSVGMKGYGQGLSVFSIFMFFMNSMVNVKAQRRQVDPAKIRARAAYGQG